MVEAQTAKQAYFAPSPRIEVHPQLESILLHCNDVKSSLDFYTRLGFQFECERHLDGVEFYCARCSGMVLELCLAQEKNNLESVRLGFRYDSLEAIAGNIFGNAFMIIDDLREEKTQIVMTLVDPDGRKVDLIQKRNP